MKLKMIQNWALTGEVSTSAETSSGAMIKASALAEAAADINDESLRWLSKRSVTWEGEAFLAMVDCEFIASDRTCEFNGSEGGAFLTWLTWR